MYPTPTFNPKNLHLLSLGSCTREQLLSAFSLVPQETYDILETVAIGNLVDWQIMKLLLDFYPTHSTTDLAAIIPYFRNQNRNLTFEMMKKTDDPSKQLPRTEAYIIESENRRKILDLERRELIESSTPYIPDDDSMYCTSRGQKSYDPNMPKFPSYWPK